MKKGIILLTSVFLAASAVCACAADEALPLVNANEAPADTVYEITPDDEVDNLPAGSGKLMTAGLSGDSKYQMFITSDEEAPEMFSRTFSQEKWTEWAGVREDGNDEITISASTLRSMMGELSEVYGAVTSGVLEVSPSGIEQGTWSYAHKGNSETRLRSAVSYKIPYGTKVIYSNPSLRVAFGLIKTPEATNYVQFSEWIDPGSTDAEYTFWDDGYLNIIIESADGMPIEPADYDCSIRIVYP